MKSTFGRPLALLVIFLLVIAGLVGEGMAMARVYQVVVKRESAGASQAALAHAPDQPRNPSHSSQTDAPDDVPPWPTPIFALDGDPFADMERMRRQMERQMRGMWASQPAFGQPARLNLAEQPDRYVLTVQVPDQNDAQVRVDAEAHQVTLRIEQKTAASDHIGDASRHTTSSVASAQSLRLAHAVDADPDHVTIQRNGDTMTVNLPKVHETRGAVI